jgi:signal transduction histidine kinase
VSKRKRFLGMAILLLTAMASYTLAYYLVRFLLELLNAPPRIGGFLLTVFFGFIIYGLLCNLLRRLLAQGQEFKYHLFVHQNILQAMNRIAKGDFSVFIDTKAGFGYQELVNGVNKMAHELGTMENLRQDFISNVSHEFQSPLTSISGFAALLKTQELSPEQQQHYLNIIETESKRLSGLSDKLLRLSALENGQEALVKKEFRLDRQIEEAALMLELQWTAKNLLVDAELEKTYYKGDEELLSQVWINLLHNAVKFTPEAGSIRIALQPGQSEVRCWIVDTGSGIPEADQMRVFERFYKVDQARDRALGGSGLGLSLVKKIVELHGGRVELESAPGKGTAFCVVLPC